MALTERIVVASRNLALVALAGGLGYGSYQYIIRFGNLDPFKSLRRDSDPLGSKTGLLISKARMHQYRHGKLVASAFADRVEGSKDRSNFYLTHVRDGVYNGPDGTTRFAADKGNWNTGTEQFSVTGGVRAEGKGFDLNSSKAVLDRRTDTLRVPTELTGALSGGKVIAASLTYNMRTHDMRTGAIRWQGKPPEKVLPDQVEKVTQRVWTLGGDELSVKGKEPNETSVYINARATDGEVLILAPRVEHEQATDVLTATGRVSYFSGKTDVTADKVVVYRKEKRAVFSGNVLMLVKPKKDQDKPPKEEPIPEVQTLKGEIKPKTEETMISREDKKRDEDLRSGKTVREYPVNIRADEITYWYAKGQRHAIIAGNLVAHQDFSDGRWRHGTGHDGYYDGELDTLQINAATSHRDVTLKNSIGDSWQAAMIRFSTKEEEQDDEEDVSGKLVSGYYVERSGEDTREPKKKTGAQPGQPTNQPPPPPPGSGSSKNGGG